MRKDRRAVLAELVLPNAGIAGAMAVAAAVGLLAVWREGYSPDEEITYFVVQGIRAEGLPILPSGLAYWRGPLYSYLAWFGGTLGGHDLATYRLISLAFAVGSVLLVGWLAKSVLSSNGVVAALLMAVAPVSVGTGAYARFYGPFVATSAVTLLIAARMHQERSRQKWFLAGCVLARGFHEFAMLLALVPAAGWLCAKTSEDRRSAARLLLAAFTVLLAEHVLLMLLPCLAPTCVSGAWGFSWTGLPEPVAAAMPVLGLATPTDLIAVLLAMAVSGAVILRVTRVDWLFAIVAGLAAAFFATGVVAALVVAWLIARPSHTRRVLAAGVAFACAGWIAWTVLAVFRSSAEPNAALAIGLLEASLTYPWSGLQFFFSEQPIISALVALGVGRAVVFSPDSRAIVARTMAIVLWVQMLSFGVSGTDVRSRFLALLLPLLAVFAAHGAQWLAEAIARALGPSRFTFPFARAAAVATVAVVLAAVLIEQARAVGPRRDATPSDEWWTKWAPAVALSSLSTGPAGRLGATDIVVTNDELAARLLLGRTDYWWPPDETVAARYGFRDSPGQPARGMYAGAPILPDIDSVRQVIEERGTRGVAIVLFNTGKFGFDPASLVSLARPDDNVEVARLPDEWQMARFPPRPSNAESPSRPNAESPGRNVKPAVP